MYGSFAYLFVYFNAAQWGSRLSKRAKVGKEVKSTLYNLRYKVKLTKQHLKENV